MRFLLAIVLLSGCTPNATSSGDATAVEGAARALMTGYFEAKTGDQAKAALELFATPTFVEKLKGIADKCRAAKQSGSELAPECNSDPIFCGEETAPVGGYKVGTINGNSATVDVTIHHSTPKTASLSLTKTGDTWKVDGVTCR
jgi:hypothetical protein